MMEQLQAIEKRSNDPQDANDEDDDEFKKTNESKKDA